MDTLFTNPIMSKFILGNNIDSYQNFKKKLLWGACHSGQVDWTSDCYAGGLPIESGILPLLKHACGEATGYYAGHQEVGRYCTRDEWQGKFITYAFTKHE